MDAARVRPIKAGGWRLLDRHWELDGSEGAHLELFAADKAEGSMVWTMGSVSEIVCNSVKGVLVNAGLCENVGGGKEERLWWLSCETWQLFDKGPPRSVLQLGGVVPGSAPSHSSPRNDSLSSSLQNISGQHILHKNIKNIHNSQKWIHNLPPVFQGLKCLNEYLSLSYVFLDALGKWGFQILGTSIPRGLFLDF